MAITSPALPTTIGSVIDATIRTTGDDTPAVLTLSALRTWRSVETIDGRTGFTADEIVAFEPLPLTTS